MAIKKLIYRSHEEWLADRKNYLGGSEISAVVGLNPYLDNETLWAYKTGRLTPEDISDKPYVQYGTKAEPHIRSLFALDYPQYEVWYEDNNSWINDKYPWAKASLDGLLQEVIIADDGTEVIKLGILEIKTSEVLSAMHKEKWHDKIPDNYYCQCLFYMAVLEADFCILRVHLKTVFDGEPYIQVKHYRIDRLEVEEDIRYLMNEGAKFWKCVQENKRPNLVLPVI